MISDCCSVGRNVSFRDRLTANHGYHRSDYLKYDEAPRTSWEGLSREVVVANLQQELRTLTGKRRKDEPNYYVEDPPSLITESFLHSFQVGTGGSIFTDILPRIQNAQSEIIFVTCFWAKSASLEKLGETLKGLSQKSLRAMTTGAPPIRVRICFSSLSVGQKLFQTNSLEGRVYEPAEYVQKLGLPSHDELSGLDLEVKCIFIKPFSVMHPKFIIVDRSLVWLPSCNVSWEEWFEGCLALSGPVVSQFLTFWQHFWNRGKAPSSIPQSLDPGETAIALHRRFAVVSEPPNTLSTLEGTTGVAIPTVFLPSPHHANPRFGMPGPPPQTPLNAFVLHRLRDANFDIYIQTPNVTCTAVVKALHHALKNGVNVHIVTSERLMLAEQLGTAGTTTAREIKGLIKRYRKLPTETPIYDTPRDPPRHPPHRGRLRVEYYEPRPAAGDGEPVQSHLKLTIVDDRFIVLGSGNMDRASFYTSQELGVAFYSDRLASDIQDLLRKNLEGRRKLVFDSDEEARSVPGEADGMELV
ncbi:uncharacterized protein K452DRAFT_257979 [Aplosporella prunicola CBS 121167]|uniref:PLD phosphodiesterase domain-containing protein n=1 Tax=Aplosporella prunicola CBS 121167 TaxID=1176127 RepID=A0A6A6B1H2_9PEZI|nr:uncharacterized protein K452DRAFT_257979 [Aplosporella prunicola CBS 121167]KAF2137223.1 hypothetical protein K452DRAFT_257979 [Aplosporella prunicola CBS 121167]